MRHSGWDLKSNSMLLTQNNPTNLFLYLREWRNEALKLSNFLTIQRRAIKNLEKRILDDRKISIMNQYIVFSIFICLCYCNHFPLGFVQWIFCFAIEIFARGCFSFIFFISFLSHRETHVWTVSFSFWLIIVNYWDHYVLPLSHVCANVATG